MYSRFASEGQIVFALKLGAIENEAEGRQMTKKAISRLIESAKQGYFQELCRAYDELDRSLQRSGDILGIAEKATTLRKQGYSVWHCGPCPECKGDDRFYVNTTDNLFKCGHAGGSGSGCGWGGGIAQLAAYVWKCSTWDAIDSLTGQSPRQNLVVRARKSTRTPIQAVSKAKEEKPYGDFSGVCRTSEARLRAPDGQVGRDYLAKRGITQATWEANRVGLMLDYKRGPTICFPHELVIDGKMQIVSLNRRFLDDEDREAKLAVAKLAGKKVDIPKTKHVSGGRWGLYHLASVSGAKGLIVVEGEINALSVWQAVRSMGWLIDVVSVGSEGAFEKLASHIATLAMGYEKLVIWADRAQVADDAAKLISHHATIEPVHSIVYESKELDANELLAMDLLTDSLESVLPAGLLVTGDELANEVAVIAPNAPTFPVTSQAPAFPRVTKEMWREWMDEPAESALAEELRQNVLKSERTYWDLPDAPDVVATNQSASVGTIAITDDAALREHVITASDELLELIVELCSRAPESSHWLGVAAHEDAMRDALREQAEGWYLDAERHYMYGDATSLLECYQAIQATLRGETAAFPDLPTTPTTPTSYDKPTAYHEWVWAVRAVRAGHKDYLGQARTWARKIEDEELREKALREMEELAGPEPHLRAALGTLKTHAKGLP